jgi:exodeoxyribonuclease VII small subunit
MMNDQNFTFEKAYERLEKILESLNSGEATLDVSLKLYEEADNLIRICQSKLFSAEQKIQTLIKNRAGDVVLDDTGSPQMQTYQPTQEHYVNRNI